MDVSRSPHPAPLPHSPLASPSSHYKKQSPVQYRPRSTVSVTRAEPEPLASPRAAAHPPSLPTALPMISEAVPCEGLREISGGVYEDSTSRAVTPPVLLHA